MVQIAGDLVQSDALKTARELQALLGTNDFFVRQGEVSLLLAVVLASSSPARIVLNRRQVGGERFVHRIEWAGIRYTCVTLRPLTVR